VEKKDMIELINPEKGPQPGDFWNLVEKTIFDFVYANNFGVDSKHVEYKPGMSGIVGPSVRVTVTLTAHMDEKIWQDRLHGRDVTASEVSGSPLSIPLSDTEQSHLQGEKE
jgi:hypothetical protein